MDISIRLLPVCWFFLGFGLFGDILLGLWVMFVKFRMNYGSDILTWLWVCLMKIC